MKLNLGYGKCPKESLPLVCITILNWNGEGMTKACLNSLRKTSYKNYRVVVLDNNSSDNSSKEIMKFKEVDFIQSSKNLGYTAGMNKLWSYCIKKYNPNYICNTNNDILTIQENWLTKMVETLEQDKKNGICGCKLVFPDNKLQWLYLERKTIKDEKDTGQYDFIKKVKAVSGPIMLIKKQLIIEVGPNDENYFYGPDDIDFCLRANKQGFTVIYNGFVKAIHVGCFSYNKYNKVSKNSLDEIFRHQSYGKMIFSFRHEGLFGGTYMSFRQLIRVFLTRKNPSGNLKLENIVFHKNVIKRFCIFLDNFLKALVNHKNIKRVEFK